MTDMVAFKGKRQLRWEWEQGCLITVIEAQQTFADPLWDEWLEALQAPPTKCALIYATGDIAPTKPQWKRATNVMRGITKTLAVVTDSKMTSAQIKAASWAGVAITAFRSDSEYDAIVSLGIESTKRRVAIRKTGAALLGLTAQGASAPSSRAPRSDTQTSRTLDYSPPASRAPAAAAPKRSYEPPRSTKRPTIDNSDTPMADAASRNLEQTRRTSEEMRAKLAEIQARLRASRIQK